MKPKNTSKSQNVERFLKNTLLLTVSSILLRTVGMWFGVYLSHKLGAEGVGLYTLVMSVSGFAITLAVSAIGLTTTRLVSEAIGRNRTCEVRVYMKKCVRYALFCGTLSSLLLFSLARPIGLTLLKDARTISSLRVLAISLPAIAVTASISGYFTAVRRVSKSAAAGVSEQLVRIFGTMLLLTLLIPSDLEKACLFVVSGSVFSDLFAFFISFILWRRDMKKHIRKSCRPEDPDVRKKLLKIAVPVAVSSYMRSALSTIEHLLIPSGLRKNGLDKKAALALYGQVQGMALPVVLYPYAFLSPFCSLLIPEVSGRYAAGDYAGILRLSERVYRFVLAFGIGCGIFMGSYALEMGMIVYKSAEAGRYIGLLAPLVPVMYLDTATDSILKGMGEQLYCMKVNLLDSAMSVLIVWLLMPKIGIAGFLIEIFFCEIVNTSLSIARLQKCTGLKIKVLREIVLPALAALGSVCLSRVLFLLLHQKIVYSAPLLALAFLIYAAFYATILLFIGNITKKDLGDIFYIVKKRA